MAEAAQILNCTRTLTQTITNISLSVDAVPVVLSPAWSLKYSQVLTAPIFQPRRELVFPWLPSENKWRSKSEMGPTTACRSMWRGLLDVWRQRTSSSPFHLLLTVFVKHCLLRGPRIQDKEDIMSERSVLINKEKNERTDGQRSERTTTERRGRQMKEQAERRKDRQRMNGRTDGRIRWTDRRTSVS